MSRTESFRGMAEMFGKASSDGRRYHSFEERERYRAESAALTTQTEQLVLAFGDEIDGGYAYRYLELHSPEIKIAEGDASWTGKVTIRPRVIAGTYDIFQVIVTGKTSAETLYTVSERGILDNRNEEASPEDMEILRGWLQDLPTLFRNKNRNPQERPSIVTLK